MKRATSRASRMSPDGLDVLESSLPGIPDGKWHELLENEDTDLFILSLREEIVNDCLRICYEKYMEKQAVAFTVHCAYLAWVKVLDVYYMFRDPGDTDDPKVRESWEPDEEPKPSIIDSWGSDCIRPKSPQAQPEKEQGKSSSATSIPPEVDSLESCSFFSDICDMGEEEQEYFFLNRTSSASLSYRRKSIFTRTLSMSRESLLINPPTSVNCNIRKKPEE